MEDTLEETGDVCLRRNILILIVMEDTQRVANNDELLLSLKKS